MQSVTVDAYRKMAALYNQMYQLSDSSSKKWVLLFYAFSRAS